MRSLLYLLFILSVHRHTSACRRLEDSSVGLVLSVFMWVLGIELRLSDSQGKHPYPLIHLFQLSVISNCLSLKPSPPPPGLSILKKLFFIQYEFLSPYFYQILPPQHWLCFPHLRLIIGCYFFFSYWALRTKQLCIHKFLS